MGSTKRVPSPFPARGPLVGRGPILRDGSPIWMKLGDPQFPCAMVFESDDHYRRFCEQSQRDKALALKLCEFVTDAAKEHDVETIREVFRLGLAMCESAIERDEGSTNE